MKTQRLPPCVRTAFKSNNLHAIRKYGQSLRRGGVYGHRRKTILHLACKYTNSLRMVRFIVEDLGVCPHTKVYRRNVTALHYACGRGAIRVVRYLVERCGCDTNLAGPYGMTPLYVAVKFNHYPLARYLLPLSRSRYLIGRHGWTLPHWASYRGNVPLLLLFPRTHWYSHTVHNDDLSTLAARGGHICMLQFLYERHYPIHPTSILRAAGDQYPISSWLLGRFPVAVHTLIETNVPAELILRKHSVRDLPISVILRYDRADLLRDYMQYTETTYHRIYSQYALMRETGEFVLAGYMWELRRLWLWTYSLALVAGVGGEDWAWGRLPVALVREIAYFL